jgi:uncharacterized membrane protein
VLPPVQQALAAADRTDLMRVVGKRFALITATLFLPLQITTGAMLAGRSGVTWAALLQPGYGRLLAAKVILFAAVMAAATIHGIAQGRHQPRAARAASIAALVGSLGVVLLATALVEGPAG